jgi:hypothetical protein
VGRFQESLGFARLSFLRRSADYYVLFTAFLPMPVLTARFPLSKEAFTAVKCNFFV